MLDAFKNFNTERMSVDELVALHAYGRQLRNEYEHLNLEEPEFVDVQVKTLKREIATRNADRLEARKRDINARLEGLKTPTQKKQELLAEKKRIDAQLAEVGG